MSDSTENTGAPAEEQAPEQEQAPKQAQSLEDLLADLDDDRRSAILGQVNKARSEAKNLRDRVKAAEPKVAEYDRLVAASKTAEERAQEAQQAAEARAQAATERVARAEIKAALAGVVDDADAVIEDLNLARFIGLDGDIDENAVAALRIKYQSLGGRRAPRPDPSQASGANGGAPASPAQQFGAILQGQLNRQ